MISLRESSCAGGRGSSPIDLQQRSVRPRRRTAAAEDRCASALAVSAAKTALPIPRASVARPCPHRCARHTSARNRFAQPRNAARRRSRRVAAPRPGGGGADLDPERATGTIYITYHPLTPYSSLATPLAIELTKTRLSMILLYMKFIAWLRLAQEPGPFHVSKHHAYHLTLKRNPRRCCCGGLAGRREPHLVDVPVPMLVHVPRRGGSGDAPIEGRLERCFLLGALRMASRRCSGRFGWCCRLFSAFRTEQLHT